MPDGWNPHALKEFADGAREKDLPGLLGALPQDDRVEALRTLEDVLRLAIDDATVTDFATFMNAYREFFLPWGFTCQVWGTDPDAGQLIRPLAEDGPVLPPAIDEDANNTPTGERWVVRAANEQASQQWSSVLAEFPEEGHRLHDVLATGNFSPSNTQQALMGRLSHVMTRGELLPLRSILTYFGQKWPTERNPRGGVKIRAGLTEGLRVICATDDGQATAWVVDVRSFRIEARPERSSTTR